MMQSYDASNFSYNFVKLKSHGHYIFKYVLYTSYRGRIMIPTKACRTLLSQFVSQGNFPKTQFESLREMLLSSCPSIVPFLDWLVRSYDDVSVYPRSIKVLLKAFAASSSVCGFVPSSELLHTLLKEIVEGIVISRHPSKLKVLQEECPLLFNALSDIKESTFPKSWYPVVKDLIKKSSEPFSAIVSSSLSTSSEQLSGGLQGISFFPILPVIRARGLYAADNCKPKEQNVCTKNHPSHSLFLPGLFTVFCPHGNYYQFCREVYFIKLPNYEKDIRIMLKCGL